MEHFLRSSIISRGLTSAIFGITALESHASLPFRFLGVNYFVGIMGLILAYSAASLFAFILVLRTTQKSMEDKAFFRQAFSRSFISPGIMFIIVFGFTVLIPPENLWTLLSQITVGLVVYAALRIKLLTAKENVMIKAWPAPLNKLAR